MSRRARAGRIAGTRARGPAPAPGPFRRGLGIVLGVTLLLGGVALAPRAAQEARERSRRAPFLLETVSVRGLERIPTGEITQALALEGGVPLLDLDVGALRERLEAHPWVAEASVLRWPPSTLRLSLRERVPLAVTPAGRPARPYGVDARGVAFAPASDDDVSRLVAVALPSPPDPGVPDPQLLEALRLAASLRERGLEVPRQLTLGLPDRERSAELRLRGFAPAVWIERGEPAEQLDRLATLLAANLPGALRARVIDLRFDGRAVLWAGP